MALPAEEPTWGLGAWGEYLYWGYFGLFVQNISSMSKIESEDTVPTLVRTSFDTVGFIE